MIFLATGKGADRKSTDLGVPMSKNGEVPPQVPLAPRSAPAGIFPQASSFTKEDPAMVGLEFVLRESLLRLVWV